MRRFVVPLALGAALLTPAPASAHSELQRSDPLDGGVVKVGTETLSLWFGQEVAPASSTFVVRAQDGTVVPTTVEGSEATTFVEITTAPLTRQTYVLEWRVFSLEDGHTTSGTVTFGAGVRPPPPPAQGSGTPAAAYFFVKWADLAALMLAIGGLAVGDRVLEPIGRRARKRARTIAVFAGLGALYAGAVTPFIRGFDTTNGLELWLAQGWMTLTETSWGWIWMAREAAVLVAVVALVVWSRRLETPVGPARVAAVSLGLVAALESWAGHASTLPGASVPVGVAATAHLIAAGVWAGGLLVLVAGAAPSLASRSPQRRRALGSMWRRFSPLAAVSSLVLLATGLYETGHHVPDLAAITHTFYGGVIAGKTVLIGLALTLAGLNTLTVHPAVAGWIAERVPVLVGRPVLRRPQASLVGTVRAEAALLAVSVALAGLLISSPTSREFINAKTPTTVHSETVDGLFVTFEEVPAGPGQGRVVVRLSEVERPNPAPVTGVDVELTGPDGSSRTVPLALTEDNVGSVPLEETSDSLSTAPLLTTEDKRFEAATTEPGPGDWVATIRIHRQPVVETTSVTRWTVPEKAREDAGPFRILTSALALLILVALAVGWRVSRRLAPGRTQPELLEQPVANRAVDRVRSGV